MMKYILVFASLFSIYFADQDLYIPMDKNSKYGDDVCRYRDKDGFYHVKPCENGKYCADLLEQIYPETSFLQICQDIPEIKPLSNLNEKQCSTTFECEKDLECDGSTCSKAPTGYFVYEDNDGYHIKDNDNKGSGYCRSTTFNSAGVPKTTYSSPENYKICGKITMAEYPGTTDAGIYYEKLVEYDYPGTVEDGEYVDSMEACQSGVALYFYYDGKFDDPKPSTSSSLKDNYMELKCVTPLAIHDKDDDGYCSIDYKIKDGDRLNYNVKQFDSPSNYRSKMKALCRYPHIKIMSEKYREYSKSISVEERKTCGDLEGNNKYTCQNNGLIKSWFGYQHPEIYIHYNERKNLEKVFAYLIQRKYPSYSYSSFLSLKILFLLFFILI